MWATHDPLAFAQFAVNHLDAAARTLALATALPVWLERDPADAATWRTQVEPRSELNPSFVALAQLPTL